MDIYLDHDPFNTPAQTLGQILHAAALHLQPTGRFVVEVRLDGQPLPETQIEALTDAAPSGDELQLITADPVDLSLATLTQIRTALESNRTIARHAAELLSDDEPQQALELIRQCLTVWQQTEQAVRAACAVGNVPLTDLVTGPGDPIGDLGGKLTQLRDQLAAGDWLGLSDTLAFELDEAVTQWIALVDRLSARISQR
jgi:hypothetical protein